MRLALVFQGFGPCFGVPASPSRCLAGFGLPGELVTPYRKKVSELRTVIQPAVCRRPPLDRGVSGRQLVGVVDPLAQNHQVAAMLGYDR